MLVLRFTDKLIYFKIHIWFLAVPDWQDPELLKDIEAATGMNLKLPPKKGHKKGNKLKSGLTNIKVVKTTPKERLTKKILKRYLFYLLNNLFLFYEYICLSI